MLDEISFKNQGLIITAPVLIPNTPDCDYYNGEKPLSKEKIKEIASSFKNYQLIDKEHSYILNGDFKTVGRRLHDWVTDEPTKLKGLDGEVREYPAGTWMLQTVVTDSATKAEIESGILTGYSVSAIPRKTADKIENLKEHMGLGSYKSRIPIGDLEDPVAYTVSLVSKPCQFGAKFCEHTLVENDNMNNEENVKITSEDIEKGFVGALKSIFNKKEEEESPSFENFATKSDLKELETKLAESVTAALKANKEEEEEEEEESEESSNSNKEEKEENNKESEESGLTDEEKQELERLLKKQKSTKSQPNKEGKGLEYHLTEEKVSTKSDNQTIMQGLGRSPDGRFVGFNNGGK